MSDRLEAPTRALLLPLFLGALLLVGCGDPSDAATPPLRFSAIPGESATKLQAKFSKFAAYLSEALDVPVEYRASADYAASVSMFQKDEIQFAWFGGLTGVIARHKVSGSRAFAQGEADPAYYSYFIAHKDAGITRSDDPTQLPAGLAGKTFGFGSPQSTSGRLMPEHFIRALSGKSPEAFFGSKPRFLNKHPLTAKAVEAGSVQAGALSYKTYDQMVKDGKLDPDLCRVVWKTPVYADYNFTARPDLDDRHGAGFTKRLIAAVLAYDDADVLRNGFAREHFIPATNADFSNIHERAKALGFLD